MRTTCPRCDGRGVEVSWDGERAVHCTLCHMVGEVSLPLRAETAAALENDESCRLGQCAECREDARLAVYTEAFAIAGETNHA